MQRIASALPLTALALFAVPVQAQWSIESLSAARVNMATVTIGDHVLFAGGNVLGTYYADVDVHDAVDDDWSSAQLSVARSLLAATVVGDLALFAGGIGAGGASKVIDVYDASVGPPSDPTAWSVATIPAFQARFDLAATSFQNKAYFAGGSAAGNGVVATVDIYDADLGPPSDPAAWSVAPLSLARAQPAAVTVGDQVIFAGGYTNPGGVPVGNVDIFDHSTGLWTTTALSVPRILGTNGAVAVGARAWFGGGHVSAMGGPNMSAVVDVYDASSESWSSASLSVARGYGAVTAVGNTVLFAGGFETGFVASDVVDMLNAGTGEWDSTSTLSQARGRLSSASVGGKALFAGGSAGPASAVVDIYEPVGVNYCAAVANSTGCAATIRADGSASLAANDLELSSVCVPNQPFLYFHAAMQIEVPFGDGLRCAGGDLVRLPVGVAAGNVATTTVDLPSADIANPGARHFQCWFRDPAAGGAGFNTSDALTIQFVP